MRARAILLALIGLILAPSAAAQTGLPANITEEAIAISSTFRGARITVFGAAPADAGDDVVVVIRGPGGPAEIARKRRVAGLWLDADPVRFQGAPAFFAVMSARPLTEIAEGRSIWELGLDPGGAARLDSVTPPDGDPAEYRAALVRLKRAKGLYQENPRGLILTQDGQLAAFHATVMLPANAPPGEYRYEVYRFRRGRLVTRKTSALPVERAGFERQIHLIANQYPALYGLGVVALALGAGWVASFVAARR